MIAVPWIVGVPVPPINFPRHGYSVSESFFHELSVGGAETLALLVLPFTLAAIVHTTMYSP